MKPRSIWISVFIFLVLTTSSFAARDFIIENSTSTLFSVNGTTGDILMAPNFGLVGIGTPTPIANLDVRGSVLFNGSTGSTPTSGAGSRFMWIPGESALRAGNVTGGAWNPEFIGETSTAFGFNTNASGRRTMAWGEYTIANGSYATAWGSFSRAPSSGSTAWGFDTRALGRESTAWGYGSIADDFQATAWGFGSQAKDTDATAFGRETYAGDSGDTAWGYRTNTTGGYATAWGSTTQAFNYAATAFGDSSRALAFASTAWGYQATASGDQATAFGNQVNASGADSFAVGEGVEALAANTIVFGSGLSTSKRLNHSQPNSMVVGFNSVYPTLFVNGSSVGINTTSPNQELVVVGTANITRGLNVTGGVRISELANCDTIDTDADGNFRCGSDNTVGGGAVSGDGEVGNITYWVGANELGNSTLYQSGGNIGIGTTNPGTELQVLGKINSSSLEINRTLFVNNSRVGIGTTAPTALLELYQTVGVSPTTLLQIQRPGGPTSSLPFELHDENQDSNTGFRLQLGNDRIYSLGVSGTENQFMISDSAVITDVPRFVISSSGNVGIGTEREDAITRLHIRVNDTNNFSTTNILTLDHAIENATNSTGGIGLGIQFRASNNVSELQNTALINATLTNSIDRNETSVLKFYTRTDGQNLTEVLALNTTTTDITGKLLVSDGANITGGARISELSSCTAIETDSDGNLICGVDDTTGGGSVVGDGEVGNISYWTAANGLGNSTLFQSAGNIGIGTIDPQTTFDVRGSVLFNGSTGSAPASGEGTRFMWIPEKAALRAGNVSGDWATIWDDENIGKESVAFGRNTNASGISSMAWGTFGQARGLESTAWGRSTATGTQSTTWGLSSLASGAASTAWGKSTASHNYATSWGFNAVASQIVATAWGESTTASGYASTAFGSFSNASGVDSIVAGEYLDALADNSIVLGRGISTSQRLNNTHANSMMVGFATREPMLFVNQSGIGINTTNLTSTLTVQGNITTTKTNNSFGEFSMVQFNSSCAGFRFGSTGGLLLSCEP